MLRPVVSKIAGEDATVDYYYVDVDQSPELAMKFGVQSIPTMILIKDGKEAGRKIGAAREADVLKFAHS
ncbi:thioredoxin family protein [Ferroacidibacillus organovorans]|uniref:Thioredoxin n=1 Tax=Ferroacidibacillus organovorans TaxID=1765683 RepID=A0A162UU45_9BACL|nr:thioredoxin family protein [Ferroacidibacillus organovorans]KYP82049.1 hypothetical protein AYJ22_04935 [Ferroacidibacillus organovorans]OAG94369.1 hypothetical protein AYW79_05755 [Ferroacidibacillus organovorans]OPG15235.1 thioredoxin [Ferroacidibacillus organovorans]